MKEVCCIVTRIRLYKQIENIKVHFLFSPKNEYKILAPFLYIFLVENQLV